jgi:hypothetical protein
VSAPEIDGDSVEQLLRVWAMIAGRELPCGWYWPGGWGNGRLYIARGPGMTIKIGRAACPAGRIERFAEPGQQRIILARIGASGRHRLLLQVSRGNGRRERTLHRALAHERVDGEWFRGPDSELLLAVLAEGAATSKGRAA